MKTKKTLTLFLTWLLVFLFLPLNALTVSAADVPQTSFKIFWSSGEDVAPIPDSIDQNIGYVIIDSTLFVAPTPDYFTNLYQIMDYGPEPDGNGMNQGYAELIYDELENLYPGKDIDDFYLLPFVRSGNHGVTKDANTYITDTIVGIILSISDDSNNPNADTYFNFYPLSELVFGVEAQGSQKVTLGTPSDFFGQIDIPVKKVWVGPVGPAVEVSLYKSLAGQTPVLVETRTLSATNNWRTIFEDLPELNRNGNAYIYEVREDIILTNYTTGITGSPENGYIITNTNNETVDVTVLKVWNDANNQDGIRPPSVSVQLKADGVNYGAAETLDGDNSWTHTWPSLPKYAGTSTPIAYTVVETPVPTGYTAGYSVNDAGAIVVTNTHTPETTSVTVVKAWNDANNQDGIRPPSVSVQLKADGVNYGAAETLDGDNSWTHTWPSLPKYAGTTTPIAYTVVETPVPTGYTAGYSVNDAGAIVVTNTHTPETTSVSVLKIWEDFQDMYGLRPLGIYVQLLQDGSPYGAAVLLNDVNNWTHSWPSLPSKNIGVPYTYTVAEITSVPGYTTAYGTIEGTFTITNTLKTFYIELVKLDARDETTPLAGATFELRSAVEDNGSLIPGMLLETLTTDAAGKAKTVATYGPVSYFLVETVAPVGFHLLADPILVEINPDGESGSTVTVTLYDEFIHEPDLTISKLVANITTASPPAGLSEAIVGETVQYTVVVTNSGNVIVTNVILTDDEALIGSNVTIVGQGDTTWFAGPGGLAAVNLGDMAPGASITIMYDYTVVAADLSREPIINTATATGAMLPTSDYPEGAVLQVSDEAIVTVDDIPLALAAISLTKRVQNLTQGGVPAELAGGYPGDVFRYTVTITNIGEEPLSLLTLTDDLALAGGAVKNVTLDTTLTWLADGNNPVYLDLGDLAPGASVTLTYDYTSVDADLELIRINTAHVIATATVTMNNDEPVTVEDEDSASIAVDEIPQTGESGTWPVWGIGLLMAALGLIVLRRRNRNSEHKA